MSDPICTTCGKVHVYNRCRDGQGEYIEVYCPGDVNGNDAFIGRMRFGGPLADEKPIESAITAASDNDGTLKDTDGPLWPTISLAKDWKAQGRHLEAMAKAHPAGLLDSDGIYVLRSHPGELEGWVMGFRDYAAYKRFRPHIIEAARLGGGT